MLIKATLKRRKDDTMVTSKDFNPEWLDRTQLEREEVSEKGQVLTNVPAHLTGIMELATVH